MKPSLADRRCGGDKLPLSRRGLPNLTLRTVYEMLATMDKIREHLKARARRGRRPCSRAGKVVLVPQAPARDAETSAP